MSLAAGPFTDIHPQPLSAAAIKDRADPPNRTRKLPTAASTLFELRRGPYVRATQLRSAVVPQLTNPTQVLQMGHGSNFSCKFWMLTGLANRMLPEMVSEV